jgi:hypothetical protein
MMSPANPLLQPRLWAAAACLLLAASAAFGATSLTQFGITWTFDRDYQTGQFANGDHWVVGPVTITQISPRSVVVDGATMHGSMVNPTVNGAQAFDSRMKSNTFNGALNVGLNLPVTVPAGSSLLSSESFTTLALNNDPQLRTVAILTVLDAAPPPGSFRPAPVGTDKRVLFNKNQLDYSVLRTLPVLPGSPSLSNLAARFERPWIEIRTNWTGRYWHPRDNQPDYGREMGHSLAEGLLALQLNYTNAEKETLLIRLVQYGLDIYGTARNGGRWSNDGGHNMGRKMPLLLAGATLRSADILTYGDASKHFIFQDDQQTWYVTQADVGRKLYTADGRPREEYIQADVGIAEWGEKHSGNPERDGRNWNAYYRDVAGAPTAGHLLVARLMGLEKTWNWSAAFDYYDRFWSIEGPKTTTGANTIRPFVKAMWNAYRPGPHPEFALNPLKPPHAPSALRTVDVP